MRAVIKIGVNGTKQELIELLQDLQRAGRKGSIEGWIGERGCELLENMVIYPTSLDDDKEKAPSE